MITFTCDYCGASETPNQVGCPQRAVECPYCEQGFTLRGTDSRHAMLPAGWEAYNTGNEWQVIVCDSSACDAMYKAHAAYNPKAVRA